MEEKETIWSRLGTGKLPSMDVNTSVAIDQKSLFLSATIIFVMIVLVTVSFFAIRKRLA